MFGGVVARRDLAILEIADRGAIAGVADQARHRLMEQGEIGLGDGDGIVEREPALIAQVEHRERDPQLAHALLRHLDVAVARSEEHTSELQSPMRISYAVFCLKKKKHKNITTNL